MATFDHALLDGLLRAAVKDRLVDYKVVAARRKELDGYLAAVAAAQTANLDDNERLALFTNAYNALVLRSFIDNGLHHPESQASKKRVIDVKGFFDGTKHKVAGEDLTLNELEERKIRRLDAEGRSRDPRIHFVVNCASKDCPPLAPRAYTGKTWATAVEEQTRAYLKRPGEVAVDEVGHRIVVVQLFEWYAADFGGEPGVRGFLARYKPELKDRLMDAATWELDFRPYDWTPNAL